MWELDHKEGWTQKNWCFRTVVLEKTLESPLDRKETQTVNPKEKQPWTFIARTDAEAETSILWPPDAKSLLIWKDHDAGKGWGQEEKWMSGDVMVAWLQQLSGNEFEHTPGDSDGQEAWHATVHGISKSQKWLSNWTTMAISQTLSFVLDMYHPIILTPSYDKYSYNTQALKSINNLSRASKCYIWVVWFEQSWYTL